MNSTNTGGPAFPAGTAFQGMTLRDYFAAKAMASMYPHYYDMFMTGVFEDWVSDGAPALARDSYAMADEMLKERGEQK